VVLSFLGWGYAESPIEKAKHVRQSALDELRQTQTMLASKIDAKRRRVGDADRDMVEVVGLRMQQAKNRLSQADSQTFRALYRQRQLLLESRQRLIDVKANVDAQLMMIEDSTIMQSSAAALVQGSRESGETTESIEKMMQEVRQSNADTMSRQRTIDAIQRVSTSVAQMDDKALERELDSLMHDDEFIGQFDPEDLEMARRQLVLKLPTVPQDEPSEERQRIVRRPTTESEMGL
jgi:hypothetical protein